MSLLASCGRLRGLRSLSWPLAMRPATVTSTIDAPREHVFDYLADIANHAGFTEHFIKDFRLERLNSRGVGAAARFRLTSPILSPLGLDVWTELVLTELERPHRIQMSGHAGRIGRVAVGVLYRLTPQDPGMTRLELIFSSAPVTASDRLREALGGRLWLTFQCRRALRRLKLLLEEGQPTAHAARSGETGPI
jgi:uncharacterized protein YndB with AHSA1/START domain